MDVGNPLERIVTCLFRTVHVGILAEVDRRVQAVVDKGALGPEADAAALAADGGGNFN